MSGVFSSAGLSLYKLLFASDAPEERKLSTPVKYLLILALFAATRLVTVWGFECRQVDWLTNDPGGYVATANYVAQHGYMPTEDKIIYRQFAGLSLLMIAANLFIGNMVISGYVVVTVCAIASLFLIQYLFDDFRLSLISCVFLPYWITTTSTIFSESPTVLCFLIGLWALRDLQARPVLLCAAMFAAGYCLVIRQTAGLFVIPFLFVLGWKWPGGGFLRAVGLVSVAMLPIALYLTWNWFTIHELFPQIKLHRESLLANLAQHADPSRYSPTMFDVPFHSLFAGLTDPSERMGKKLSVAATVVIVFIALLCLLREIHRERWNQRGILAAAFTVALLIHALFLVTLGGDFGYKWLDRHLSQINPIIDWALFYQRPLRWTWIALLVVAGVIFAISTGIGSHFGIFK
jgi:hypothetical protein